MPMCCDGIKTTSDFDVSSDNRTWTTGFDVQVQPNGSAVKFQPDGCGENEAVDIEKRLRQASAAFWQEWDIWFVLLFLLLLFPLVILIVLLLFPTSLLETTQAERSHRGRGHHDACISKQTRSRQDRHLTAAFRNYLWHRCMSKYMVFPSPSPQFLCQMWPICSRRMPWSALVTMRFHVHARAHIEDNDARIGGTGGSGPRRPGRGYGKLGCLQDRRCCDYGAAKALLTQQPHRHQRHSGPAARCRCGCAAVQPLHQSGACLLDATSHPG